MLLLRLTSLHSADVGLQLLSGLGLFVNECKDLLEHLENVSLPSIELRHLSREVSNHQQ